MNALMTRVRTFVDAPYYGPVPLTDPQQITRVWLDGPEESVNVTRNNVVAALRPFMIGIMRRQELDSYQETNEISQRTHAI